jgi:hypothetical protein
MSLNLSFRPAETRRISMSFYSESQFASMQAHLRNIKKQREKTPKQIIEILTDFENIDIDCPVCLDTHEKKTCVYIVNCKHIFCKTCFFNWMQKRKSCPLCRTQCNEIIDFC